MIQRLTTSGSAHCANAINWFRADKCLFAHNRRGSAISNSIPKFEKMPPP